jgi:8-oxo-dGTP pyrophosphatase MutT (NUDIX family)
MIKNNVCNNCNKPGHLFHNCKLPITSYGLIVFRKTTKGNQYLMIRRKDSFGYIDFIRGKYITHNIEQIKEIINEMSLSEKKRIIDSSDFYDLWKQLWGINNILQYKGEEVSSAKKYETLKGGIIVDGTNITLSDLINDSITSWDETEWEFPKGRKNFQEKDLDCAIREFQEETGYNMKHIHVIENIVPYEETFIGNNNKSYKHKYYLAHMDETIDKLNSFQRTEVSKIEWKTIDECLQCIRPYNLEKKQIIININKVLQEYRLYS